MTAHHFEFGSTWSETMGNLSAAVVEHMPEIIGSATGVVIVAALLSLVFIGRRGNS